MPTWVYIERDDPGRAERSRDAVGCAGTGKLTGRAHGPAAPLSGGTDRNADADKDEDDTNATAIPSLPPSPRAPGGLRRYRGGTGHRRRRSPGRPGRDRERRDRGGLDAPHELAVGFEQVDLRESQHRVGAVAPDDRRDDVFELSGYTAWELPEEDESSVSESASSGMVMRMSAGRAFEPLLEFDILTDGRLALIDSIGYRVKLIGLDGSVTGTIERPIAPLPVDDAIMEAERERYREREAAVLGSASNLPIQTDREGVEGRTFADEVPVLYRLKVDWEDRIWLQRRGPTGQGDGPTDIVTPDGDYIGTLPPDELRTPDAFGPDGLLAYIEHDDMDVSTVRVIRLVALEPGG